MAAIDLGVWGILPRTLSGLVGIVTAPLIHGSPWHLLSNSFPLIMLMIAIFYFYDKIALEVFVWIYLATGFWVWVVAREAYHIGSSGLVYGLAAFLFFSGIFRRDARSMAVALIIAFVHGDMLQGLVPTDDNVSWESHLMGSAAGIFCSLYFRKELQLPVSEQIAAEHHTNRGRLSSTYQGQSFVTIEEGYEYKTADKSSGEKFFYVLESEFTASETYRYF